MHAELIDVQRITDVANHHGFTDLCNWKGKFYCAYRTASTHDIVPAGHVVIMDGIDGTKFLYGHTLHHAVGDVRDPKFLVDKDVLWCMCGVYLPAGGRRELSSNPEENILQTHVSYTTNGSEWSNLLPIMRPNYWGWSAARMVSAWAVASYHTGKYGEPSSIVLWAGKSPLKLCPIGTIYDGGSIETRGHTPSEPVLYFDRAVGVARIFVRTEDVMDMGAAIGAMSDSASWRWRLANERIHPSATIGTPHGRILAGRSLSPKRAVHTGSVIDPGTYEAKCRLWLVSEWNLMELLTLPSGRDCAYPGLAMDGGEVLCSYYSSHEAPAGTPGSAVYVARIKITG